MAARRRAKDRKPALPKGERELVEQCMEALQRVVPIERWKCRWPVQTRDGQTDALVELRLDGRPMEFALETKRGLRRAHVGPLAHLAHRIAKEGRDLVVCTERMPEAAGEALREAGIGYADLGGNAFLRAPGVYLHITGRPVATAKAQRALTGTEVRLLGVLLRDADAGEAVQKDLAARAGIALGAVGRARERLERARILTRMAKRKWRVTDREAGLRKFAEGWATVVRHKLHPKRYRRLGRERRGTHLGRVLEKNFRDLECLLGGERAAALLTDDLHTDHATLHTPPENQKRVVKALDLVPDEEGPITLLDRYGQGDRLALPVPTAPMAHPLLVWAECMTIPDERVARIAGQLYERFLEEAP